MLTLTTFRVIHFGVCLQEEVARDIEVVLAERAGLESVLKQLRNQWRPKVEQLKDEADKLSSAVGSTAALADRVSAKVKQLDLAKVPADDKKLSLFPIRTLITIIPIRKSHCRAECQSVREGPWT